MFPGTGANHLTFHSYRFVVLKCLTPLWTPVEHILQITKRLHPLHGFKQVHHDISLWTDGPHLTTSMFWKAHRLHLKHKEVSIYLFGITNIGQKKVKVRLSFNPSHSKFCCLLFLFQIKDVGHENMKAHTPLCLQRGSIETIVSAH